MKLLVVVDSKHGSTLGIAEALAEELRQHGHQVDVRPATAAPDPSEYAAVLVGSAIYMGAWRDDALRFVESQQHVLRERPVWLFSSGPLGDADPKPKDPPQKIEALVTKTGARAHELFRGRLDRSELGVGERLITRIVRAPEGDFRNWEAIRAWATLVAQALAAES